MWKPDPDPIYVRASIWSKCDLTCLYCPVEEGMENRVPATIAGDFLSTPEYLRNMNKIARAGVPGLSFTGGEPTLRPDIADLIVGVRPMFDRVELTTNGYRLAKITNTVKKNIDLLKISLDSVQPNIVSSITGRHYAYDTAIKAIHWAVDEGVSLGINVVLMRQTVSDIRRTIEFFRKITHRATASVYLSLLDFYYTPSRRQEWLSDFLPTSAILDLLTKSFGSPQTQERFGCNFYWFDAGGLRIRLKDSFGATMRAIKCEGCRSYCQEGIYGVKHSMEGWFTTCPNDREDLGAHLHRNLKDGELDDRINSILYDVHQTKPQPKSFSTMCETHSLSNIVEKEMGILDP